MPTEYAVCLFYYIINLRFMINIRRSQNKQVHFALLRPLYHMRNILTMQNKQSFSYTSSRLQFTPNVSFYRHTSD